MVKWMTAARTTQALWCLLQLSSSCTRTTQNTQKLETAPVLFTPALWQLAFHLQEFKYFNTNVARQHPSHSLNHLAQLSPVWPLLAWLHTTQFWYDYPTLSISCCRTCLATSRSCSRTLSSSFSCSRRLLFFSTLSSWLWRRMDTSFATWEGEGGGMEEEEFRSVPVTINSPLYLTAI